jgi:hypothetical protein
VLISEFEELLAESCPTDLQFVFAVLVNGTPTNLSLRYSGRTGKSVIEKFLSSVAVPGRLRDLINAGPNYLETKVLFQFLGVCRKGDASNFRRQWYAKYLDLAERVHGRQFSHRELLKLPPNRELQFQSTVTIDSLEITDFKLSKVLESLIENPPGLTHRIQVAHSMNLPKYST